MQFSFNFLSEDIEQNSSAQCQDTVSTTQTDASAGEFEPSSSGGGTIQVIECPDLNPAQIQKRSSAIDLQTANGTTFRMMKVSEDNPENEFDLIPGKYEGGSKIWECSVDLAQYLLLNQPVDNERHSSLGSVLELGCGHALPAIAAISLGFSPAVCLDFNDYVLSSSTWPGIALNCPESLGNVQCLGGDWQHFTNDISSGRIAAPMHYDLILSAETLYSVESCRMIFRLLKAHLAPTGVALIASKKYYFGVGGGTLELQSLVEGSSGAEGTELQCSVVFTAADGKSNVREIIEVRRRA